MLLPKALFHSFLWLSSIPLCVCVPIFFIHLSVDGQLGCFHVLAMANSAAMKMWMFVSLQISFLWIYDQ